MPEYKVVTCLAMVAGCVGLFATSYLLRFSESALITNTQNGAIDSSYYFYLIKSYDFGQLIIETPNIQSLPFLFLAKTACMPFGCSLVGYFVFGSVLLLFIIILAKFDVVVVFLILPLVIYVITPGKEGYLLIGLLLWYNHKSNFKKYLGFLIAAVSRPGYAIIYLLPTFSTSFRIYVLIGLCAIYLGYDTVFKFAKLYQDANVLAYSSPCNLSIFSFCYKDGNLFHTIYIFFNRIIFGIFILPFKSVLDLRYYLNFEAESFNFYLDFLQALSAFIYYKYLLKFLRIICLSNISLWRLLRSVEALTFTLILFVVYGLVFYSMERILPFLYLALYYLFSRSKALLRCDM
ncbi:hypothetical protein OAQ78_02390 [Amylibacter sp.]|nr:hypothetical protein [Amylibacter sp.]MDC1041463.1 hypothetical protein [Amylibacter sp.]